MGVSFPKEVLLNSNLPPLHSQAARVHALVTFSGKSGVGQQVTVRKNEMI